MCFESGLEDAQGGGKPNCGREAVPKSWARHGKGSVALLPQVGHWDFEEPLASGSQSPGVVRRG